MCEFKTHSVTRTNELFYAGAVAVTNRLGVKINKTAERKEPMWRRRLQNKINELRKGVAAKVGKYQEKADRFRQNRMFQNNQRQFYTQVNQGGERCDSDEPGADDSKWRPME